jgi:hypothetical protein
MSKGQVAVEAAEKTITVATPVLVSFIRLHKRVSFYSGLIIGGLLVYGAMKDRPETARLHVVK